MHARFHRFLNWGEAYSEYRSPEIGMFGEIWCTDWVKIRPIPSSDFSSVGLSLSRARQVSLVRQAVSSEERQPITFGGEWHSVALAATRLRALSCLASVLSTVVVGAFSSLCLKCDQFRSGRARNRKASVLGYVS